MQPRAKVSVTEKWDLWTSPWSLMSALTSSSESLDFRDKDFIAEGLNRPNPTPTVSACYCAFAHAVPAACSARPALVHQKNTCTNICQAERATPFLGTRGKRSMYPSEPEHTVLRPVSKLRNVFHWGRGSRLNHFCIPSLTLYLLHSRSH